MVIKINIDNDNSKIKIKIKSMLCVMCYVWFVLFNI
jgi:hypothetical protein